MKTEKITFNIPDDLLVSLKIGVKGIERDMRQYLAIEYFKHKRLTIGKAARLAGMNRFDFIDLLASEGVVQYDYDENDIKEELQGVKKLKEMAV